MWAWGNDTPPWLKRTVYFIYRQTPAGTEYLMSTDGRLRRWKTAAGVKTFLGRLLARAEDE